MYLTEILLQIKFCSFKKIFTVCTLEVKLAMEFEIGTHLIHKKD